jgi:hypothetical protein
MESAHIEYDVRVPLTEPLYVGNAAITAIEPEKETISGRAEEPRQSHTPSKTEIALDLEAPAHDEEAMIVRRSGRDRKLVEKYTPPPAIERPGTKWDPKKATEVLKRMNTK